MIGGLMHQTCRLRRFSSRDSFGDPVTTESEVLPCMFMDRAGLVVKDKTGADVVINGFLYLNSTVQETDTIVFDGYEYEIVSGGISYGDDLLTETTDHVRVAVTRRRPAGEEASIQ